MTADPAAGVVARWTARRQPPRGAACDECGATLADVTCERCGQLAGRLVGMLAVVVHLGPGPELVVAERTDAGGWAVVRRITATPENVKALARPGATGPAAAVGSPRGLW